MKRLFILAGILFAATVTAHSQQANTLTIRFAGAPSGPCAPFMLAVNNATGGEYNCTSGGAWNLIGGGGGSGTVTSVSFTGGLISVATPTTTPAFTVAGTSGGIPFFDSASTWNTSALLPAGSLVLGGGAATAPSGSASFTAPGAQLLGPAGTQLAPTYASSAQPTAGWFFNGTSIQYSAGNTDVVLIGGTPEFRVPSGFIFGWTPTTSVGTKDIALSRSGIGVLAVGTGAVGSTNGRLKASGYMSAGTKFTTDTGCGTVTTLVGGATAGSFVANTTGACTVVITMGDSATAPNGWICSPSDRTTGNLFRQSASSTTTCTVTGTAVSGDVISFAAIGY